VGQSLGRACLIGVDGPGFCGRWGHRSQSRAEQRCIWLAVLLEAKQFSWRTSMQPQMKSEIKVISPAIGPAIATRWNPGQKVALRFACVYFALYYLPFPFYLPIVNEGITDWWELPLHRLLPWIAQHVLHLAHPITVFSNGSGDTTYD